MKKEYEIYKSTMIVDELILEGVTYKNVHIQTETETCLIDVTDDESSMVHLVRENGFQKHRLIIEKLEDTPEEAYYKGFGK